MTGPYDDGVHDIGQFWCAIELRGGATVPGARKNRPSCGDEACLFLSTGAHAPAAAPCPRDGSQRQPGSASANRSASELHDGATTSASTQSRVTSLLRIPRPAPSRSPARPASAPSVEHVFHAPFGETRCRSPNPPSSLVGQRHAQLVRAGDDARHGRVSAQRHALAVCVEAAARASLGASGRRSSRRPARTAAWAAARSATMGNAAIRKRPRAPAPRRAERRPRATATWITLQRASRRVVR